MAELRLWEIKRQWHRMSKDGVRSILESAELDQFAACCLLGAGGIGKTVELERLASSIPGVLVHRIVDEGTSAADLSSSLKEISQVASPGDTILLDSLDEALIPLKQASSVITKWIKSELPGIKNLKLRVSSRPGLWPSLLEDAIRNAYGDHHTAVVTLAPLDYEAIKTAAIAEGIAWDDFSNAIERSGANALADSPLTLRMLFRIFKAHNELPAQRVEVFRRAIQLMVKERDDRSERGTEPSIPYDQIRKCGEVVACLLLVGGLRGVNQSDEPVDGLLNWNDLDSQVLQTAGANQVSLAALKASGLSTSDQIGTFRFVHQQVAEYLAARRIAEIPLHQILSLLTTEQENLRIVRGTLREVAVFTASLNEKFQRWLVDNDPMLVGQSDVAGDELKKLTVHKLAAKFKCRELTDSQLYQAGLRLETLNYHGAELDLKGWLIRRDQDDTDLIEFAIRCVDVWKLEQLGGLLVDIALDDVAPYECRRSALYALRHIGRPPVKASLRGLWSGDWSTSETTVNLAGLGWQITWRDTLTTLEILTQLRSFEGLPKTRDYDRFISALETSRFAACKNVVAGLRWVKGEIFKYGAANHLRCIAHWICHEACSKIDDDEIRNALLEAVLSATNLHPISPLENPRSEIARGGVKDADDHWMDPTSSWTQTQRREFIKALVERADSRANAQFAARSLVRLDDFAWLIEQSQTTLNEKDTRTWLSLCHCLRWNEDASCVNAWIEAVEHRNTAVIDELGGATHIFLGTDLANALKDEFKKANSSQANPSAVRSWTKELAGALTASESNPLAWHGVFRYATGSVDGYALTSYVHLYDGWKNTDVSTRQRIVESAKCYCETCNIASLYQELEPTCFCSEPFGAFLIIAHCDAKWLGGRDVIWWRQWMPHVLHELSFGHPTEDIELRDAIFRLIELNASEPLIETVRELVTQPIVRNFRVERALPFLQGDTAKRIAHEIAKHVRLFQSRCMRSAIQFILNHAPEHASTIVEEFKYFQNLPNTGLSIQAKEIAVSLMISSPKEFFQHIVPVLENEHILASNVVRNYLQLTRYCSSGYRDEKNFEEIPTSEMAAFVSLMFELYPPKKSSSDDPTWNRREEERFRDSLVDAMRSRSDAVGFLQRLEVDYAESAFWIRRTRAMAEQTLRNSVGAPLPVTTIATLLASDEQRLISSPAEVRNAICEAIRQQERELNSSSPSPVRRLWNTPHKQKASTKTEEEVSDELLLVVREYFKRHGVTAAREVQIHRRNIGSDIPGSRLDLCCQIPALATTNEKAIAIPIEIKL